MIEYICGVKAILYHSPFFVVGWAEPYVWGIMLHHFISRNWGKAVIWLLGLLAILCITALAIIEDVMSHGRIYVYLFFAKLSIWVLLGQALFWAAFWRKHLIDDDAPGWRTVAIVAFIVSLLFAFNIHYAYGKDIKNRQRSQQWQVEVQKYLDNVGYQPYSATEGRWSHSRDNAIGNYAHSTFYTKDRPKQVFRFYRQCAKNAGLRVLQGQKKRTQWLVEPARPW